MPLEIAARKIPGGYEIPIPKHHLIHVRWVLLVAFTACWYGLVWSVTTGAPGRANSPGMLLFLGSFWVLPLLLVAPQVAQAVVRETLCLDEDSLTRRRTWLGFSTEKRARLADVETASVHAVGPGARVFVTILTEEEPLKVGIMMKTEQAEKLAASINEWLRAYGG